MDILTTPTLIIVLIVSAGFFLWSYYRHKGENILDIASKVSITAWINSVVTLQLGPALLLGGLGIIFAYQALIPTLPQNLKSFSLFFLALGFILFLFGVRQIQTDKPPSRLERLFERLGGWLSVQPAQLVYLMLGFSFAMIATLAAGDSAMMRNLPLAILSWIVGVVLTILGAWDGKVIQGTNYSKVFRWTLLFFVVGFLVRGIDLSNIPIILTGDESSGGLTAVEFVNDRMNNIFLVGWYDFPSLYFYLQSFSISLFGQTAAALRITSAIVGGLTVAATYLIGRVFYGHRSGIYAAIFLAGFHFHIHFSRLGLNNIWDGLSYVLVWAALWYGWKNNHRSAFLVAGIVLGISQYFYVSVRGLFGLIPVWLLIAALIDSKKLRSNAINLSLMAFSTIVVLLPLAWFFYGHPNQFQAPLSRFSILGEWLIRQVENTGLSAMQIMWEQLKTSFQAFTITPIRTWYQPDVPLLRPYPASIFMIGLAMLLLKLKDSRTYIILLWLTAFVFIGAMSTPVPAAQRYVAVAPAIALVLGFSLGELNNLLVKVWNQRSRLIAAVALALAVFLAIDDARFYYFDYTEKMNFSDPNGWVAQSLSDYLQDRDEGWQVAFFGAPRMGYRSISSLPYLAPHVVGVDMNQPWGSPENPELTSDKLIFVFLPENENDLNAVRASYPDGQLNEEYFINGVFLYWTYEVTLSDL